MVAHRGDDQRVEALSWPMSIAKCSNGGAHLSPVTGLDVLFSKWSLGFETTADVHLRPVHEPPACLGVGLAVVEAGTVGVDQNLAGVVAVDVSLVFKMD